MLRALLYHLTQGFDDPYSTLLKLVGQNSKYEVTTAARVKRALNSLRMGMMLGGISRCIANGSEARGQISPIKLRRQRTKYITGAIIEVEGRDNADLNTAARSASQGLDHDGPHFEIVAPDDFPPGSVMAFETQMQYYDSTLDMTRASGAEETSEVLDLIELNVILHRAAGILAHTTYCYEKAANWFKERFERVKASVSPHQRPQYFALVISASKHGLIPHLLDSVRTPRYGCVLFNTSIRSQTLSWHQCSQYPQRSFAMSFASSDADVIYIYDAYQEEKVGRSA
ncbi:hypothetical protein HDZ31DRAFT_66815 [Schizophyllum fasciatum]